MNDVRSTFQMPTRTEFWKILKSKGILVNSMEYLIIDVNNLNDIDVSIAQKIPDTSVELVATDNAEIFLTNVNETNGNLSKRVVEASKFKNDFALTDLHPRYLYLLENGAIESIERAKFNVEKFLVLKENKIFDKFDEISRDDFKIIKSNETVNRIIEKLTERQILSSTEMDKFKFIYANFNLITESSKSDILGEDSVYRSAIISLLRHKFSYRIALEVLANKIIDNTQSGQSSIDTTIHLHINPHLNLLNELMSSKVIQMPKVNKDKVDDLNKIEKLELFQNAVASLSSSSFEKTTTLDILKNLADDIKKNFKSIEKSLKSFVPALLNEELEILEVSFKSLEDALKERVKSRGEEVSTEIMECLKMYKCKGLDKIIIVQQQKYSSVYWQRVIVISALAILQVVAALLLLYLTAGASSYFSNILLQQGLSDIVFLIQSSTSGHFSWSDYGKQKAISVAASIMFMGFSGGAVTQVTGKVTGEVLLKLVAVESAKRLGQVVVEKTAHALIEKFLGDKIGKLSTDLVSGLNDDFWKEDGLSTTIDELLKFSTPNAVVKFIAEKYHRNDIIGGYIAQGISFIATQVKSFLKEMKERSSSPTLAEIALEWSLLAASVIASSSLLYNFCSQILGTLRDAAMDEITKKNLTNIQTNQSQDQSNSDKNKKVKNRVITYIVNETSNKVSALITQSMTSAIGTAYSSAQTVVEKKVKDYNATKAITENTSMTNVLNSQFEDNKKDIEASEKINQEIKDDMSLGEQWKTLVHVSSLSGQNDLSEDEYKESLEEEFKSEESFDYNDYIYSSGYSLPNTLNKLDINISTSDSTGSDINSNSNNITTIKDPQKTDQIIKITPFNANFNRTAIIINENIFKSVNLSS